MILPLYVALERIDPALLDAANDLGAAPHRVLRRVILPLAKPGIVAGCILVGIPATGEYVIPQILGGGKTLMIGNVVADQFLSIGDYPFGAALAIVLTAIVMIALVLLRRGERRAGVGMRRRVPKPRVLFTALVFVCLYAPILLVIVFSLNKDAQLLHWEGFTLEWYRQAFHDEAVRKNFGISVQVAVALDGDLARPRHHRRALVPQRAPGARARGSTR